MSYTLKYLINGRKKIVSLNDWQASQMQAELAREGTHINIGKDTAQKKHVEIEKDSETQVKKGDLRTELNRAANFCKICNRRGFILMADGQMHPCKCQIAVKQAHGKDGYDYSLYGDENVKTDVKLLEPDKAEIPKLDDMQIRAGMIRAIKSAIDANPNLNPSQFFNSIIERYAIAPEEVKLPTNAW